MRSAAASVSRITWGLGRAAVAMFTSSAFEATRLLRSIFVQNY
jgi:hypothetical protein